MKTAVTAILSRLNSCPGQVVLYTGVVEAEQYAVCREVFRKRLCLGDSSPCGSCRFCKALGQDVWFEGVVLRNTSDVKLSIQEVREGLAKLNLAAAILPYRILILTGLDGFSVEIQNTLLKILEEPPSGTVVVLGARQTRTILPTVLSRVVRVGGTETKTDLNLKLLQDWSGADFKPAKQSGAPFRSEVAEVLRSAAFLVQEQIRVKLGIASDIRFNKLLAVGDLFHLQTRLANLDQLNHFNAHGKLLMANVRQILNELSVTETNCSSRSNEYEFTT